MFKNVHKILLEKVLSPQVIALCDGRNDEAIRIAKSQLSSNPEDIESHFILAQAYESKKKFVEAIFHAESVLTVCPTSFEALSLAVRASVKLKKYDDAFQYAEKALKDRREPSFSEGEQFFLKVISYIPGFKGCRDLNESSVRSYAKNTQWLHEYVVWYIRSNH